MERIKVMISSTIEDLSEEREVADEAIQQFKFHRFRSESMGSLSRPPQEICDEMADECDIFILIVGERYGWIIPEMKISVTEREYDVARNSDKEKILVYSKKCNNREIEEVKFLNKVSDFSNGYFKFEFQTKQELKNRIKEDISIWVSNKIRKSKLSPSHVLDIELPEKQVKSNLQILIGIILLAFIYQIASSTKSVLLPPLQKIFSLNEYSTQIFPSILSYVAKLFLVIAITALLLFGVNFYYLKFKDTSFLRTIAFFMLIVGFVLFFQGNLYFASGSIFGSDIFVLVLYCSALQIFNYIKEANELDVSSVVNDKFIILKSLSISSKIINVYASCILIYFISGLFASHSNFNLGSLFWKSRLMYYIETTYLILLALLFTYFITRSALAILQSYFGWNFLIKPILKSKPQYAKL